jgi:antirestriction protein ArdC
VTTEHRRDSLLARLSAGIEALCDSAQWVRYLDMQQRFHHYSPTNVLLIISQFPDATQVAGFRTWQTLGRRVRRGERAIWILAPVFARLPGPADDETSRSATGFRPVAVFDVSQTDGDDLPSPCAKLTGGDPGNAFVKLTGVARELGYDVQYATLGAGINGDCAFDLRRIRVEARNSPAQHVKTLAHELAHALLHEDEDHRAVAELEAESAAYVACGRLGLETDAYSFGYVTIWAGGGPQAIAAVRTSCARIQWAADAMLASLEAAAGQQVSEAAA